MHPSCFEMFKRMSKARFGNVDIDGVWKVREVSLIEIYAARFIDSGVALWQSPQGTHI